MKHVAIIQARTGSTRLPGKVLEPIGGISMLAQVVGRVASAKRIDEVVVATTDLTVDDAVEHAARAAGAGVFRGSERDVLGRYIGAARMAGADVVVRVTADCPLIDPGIVDAVVEQLTSGSEGADYAANVIDRTYPRGLDVEALFRDALERVGRLAVSEPAREHVTYFILRERPDLFVRRSVVDSHDNSDLRWTVDEPADLALVRLIYEELGLTQVPRPYGEVLKWIRSHPKVASVNAHVAQKA